VVQNSATTKGGGFDTGTVLVSTNNTIQDNSAIAGPNLIGAPATLFLLTPNDSNPDRLLQHEEIAPMFHAASGEVFTSTIHVAIIDFYGNMIKTDSLSMAELMPVDPNTTTIGGQTKVKAQSGIFSFTNFEIISEPGMKRNVSISTTSINPMEKENLGAEVMSNVIELTVHLRECRIGEILVGKE
jgi:hypothetical protein